MEYTAKENSIYVAKVPKYERLVNAGNSTIEASIICAKEIIASDECKLGGVLERRYNNTKHPEDSFAQHIRHMYEVVNGLLEKEAIRRSDELWYKVFKK